MQKDSIKKKKLEQAAKLRSKRKAKQTSDGASQRPPNILMIMVDQMRFPRFGYGDKCGFVDPLKRLFGFQGSPYEANEFKKFFPGLWKLRNNAVVLNNHRTASTACVPSRAAIFSGQYGAITKVTQTDGTLKDGMDPDYSWLDPKEFPTIGDWMKAAGYTTHYFGKWHVSGDDTPDLEEYGFSDWDLSYPDPYGNSANNLGYYRDYQFSAVARSFLQNQSLGVPYNIALAGEEDSTAPSEEPTPWFAVCSFNNPHDIGLYPSLPRQVNDATLQDASFTLAVPPQDSTGTVPTAGTIKIKLNKFGFPQNNANVSPTWDEDMKNKPSCQFESAYKVGLALMSNAGLTVVQQAAEDDSIGKEDLLDIGATAMLASDQLGLPLALTSDTELACRAFMQYYGYLMHEVDQHINAVLETLEETGQAENTIVIFTADHGEYGGAHHMMTEKWHSAYEEAIHVPMVVRFPSSYYHVPGTMKQIDVPTSHIDILPTVLGLAGVNTDKDRHEIMAELRQTPNKTKTYKPVGADLSKLIKGEDKSVIDPTTNDIREGVLFATYDTISAPMLDDENAQSSEGEIPTKYEIYCAAVDKLIHRAEEKRNSVPEEAANLAPGSIKQPCLVHSMVSPDGWKIVRYFSNFENIEEDNEYELYDLNTDPNEQDNLLVFDGEFPTVVDSIPENLSQQEIINKANNMKESLVSLEGRMLKEKEPRKTAST